jgi:hypothetical protein
VKTAAELAAKVCADRDARESVASKKAQYREWAREAAAARAAKLAGKIDDPELLLMALQFYLRLEPGVWTPAAPIHELTGGKTRRFKNHCTAVRRILGIRQRDFHREMRLPLNWRQRLVVVGLTSDLLVDQCPDLAERTKAFLRGERPKQEKPPKRDPWWVRRAAGRVQYVSLHEAMATKPDVDQDSSDEDEDRYDDEPPEKEQSFSRAAWLQARIRSFLGPKS